MIGVLLKMTICRICVCVCVCVCVLCWEGNEAYKIGEYLGIKNCSCRKYIFGKFVLTCKDEILNTTEVTLIVDKRSSMQESNCFVDTVSLVLLSGHFY